MKEVLVTWSGGMAFKGHSGSGHDVLMDALPEVGGQNAAARPTELLLAALGGCSGMDVISILRKMRVPVDRFEMAVEADDGTEHPKAFTAFRIVYRIWGSEVTEEKYRRAVELSQSGYCSVGNLFKKGATVSYRMELNGTLLT